MVPNTRFKELLADIEPSATTTTQASTSHNSIRDHLRTEEQFQHRWEDDFLAGSYARSTAIRPKKSEDGYERPDVDVIVVTSFTTSDDPTDVLVELRDALDSEFEVERINKRSVRVITPGADVDVVPVIGAGNIYQIPDRELDDWKLTNPQGHTTWSKTTNDAFGGKFKPLVKLFKWWRRENNTGKRPKGFVLEVLASMHAPKGEEHFGEIITQMLEGMYASYGYLASLGHKPTIEDPSLPGNDILSKVSITDWKNFIDRVRVHGELARRAQSTDDMEEATKLWQRLFGDRFKPTANAAKSATLGGYAAAPPAAAGGYTFPDTQAAPKKPRGFA